MFGHPEVGWVRYRVSALIMVRRNTESLGLRLVISLVEQLSGTIELDRSAGTAFSMVVQEKE